MMSISQTRTAVPGTFSRIAGIVTRPDGTVVFIQDGSPGIAVDVSQTGGTTPESGDAVTVDGQRHAIADPLPNRSNQVEIGARLDLELDAAITLADGYCRGFRRLFRRRGKSQGNPGGNLRPGATEQLGQGKLLSPGSQVPTSHLK